MRLFLDTNVVSKIIRGRQPALRHRLDKALASGASASISAIVLHELHYGAERSPSPERNRGKIAFFVLGIDKVEPFLPADGELAGKLRAMLAAKGEPIGPYDLLIAAQTLRLEATLVTGNAREFARIPGLKWIDWTAP